jgi:hypothetical protein
MTTRLVSMSEIMRVAPWSLRALGHPFGVAERATRLVTWTQAAIGHGLELLRVGESKLAASTRAPAALRRGDGAAGRYIDAQGRSLLELGPPAIDLVTCDARDSGAGAIMIENAIGTLLVPAIADLAVRRDLVAVVAYRAGAGEIGIAGFPAEGWVATCRTSDGPKFFSGDLDSLRGMANLFDGEMKVHLLKHAGALASGDALVTIAATTSKVAMPTGVVGAVDYADRVARAYRAGIEVATEDLNHLYALERITWAPTSERSRKQAGY